MKKLRCVGIKKLSQVHEGVRVWAGFQTKAEARPGPHSVYSPPSSAHLASTSELHKAGLGHGKNWKVKFIGKREIKRL